MTTDMEDKTVIDLARTTTATLCEDEGCPHYGTPHICISTRERANSPGLSARDQYLDTEIARKAFEAKEEATSRLIERFSIFLVIVIGLVVGFVATSMIFGL